MGFFKKIFSSSREDSVQLTKQDIDLSEQIDSKQILGFDHEYSRASLTYKVSEQEKELVSVVISSVLAGQNPNSRIKIHNVVGIDTEKEIAGIVASVIAAGDCPSNIFKLKSVEEINNY